MVRYWGLIGRLADWIGRLDGVVRWEVGRREMRRGWGMGDILGKTESGHSEKTENWPPASKPKGGIGALMRKKIGVSTVGRIYFFRGEMRRLAISTHSV